MVAADATCKLFSAVILTTQGEVRASAQAQVNSAQTTTNEYMADTPITTRAGHSTVLPTKYKLHWCTLMH